MSEYPTYLIHYGIQGQKWGVRRFQNEDGTYTSEGLERRRQYEYGSERDNKKLYKQATKAGRNAKIMPLGGVKYNITIENYKKFAKNKAVKDALKDEKLNESYNKWLNTERKYYEPDPDPIYDEVFRKVLNKYNKQRIVDLDDKVYHKYLQKAGEEYNKQYRKFKELDKKDPSTIAFKEHEKEIERVAKILAGDKANDKIGDVTYQQIIKRVLDDAIARQEVKKKK